MTQFRVGSPVFALAIAVTVPMKTRSFFEISRALAFPIPNAATLSTSDSKAASVFTHAGYRARARA